jgi:hypothetical protein
MVWGRQAELAARTPKPNGTTMTKLEEYIDALSETIDYDIERDQLGSHVIIIDKDISVMLREDDAGTQAALFSIVAPKLPKGISYQDAEDLVDMACGPFYGGPGLGRLPIVGAMVLFQHLPYAKFDKEKFLEEAGEFIDLAQEYYDKFAEMGDLDEDEEDDGEDDGEPFDEDEDFDGGEE